VNAIRGEFQNRFSKSPTNRKFCALHARIAPNRRLAPSNAPRYDNGGQPAQPRSTRFTGPKASGSFLSGFLKFYLFLQRSGVRGLTSGTLGLSRLERAKFLHRLVFCGSDRRQFGLSLFG
jgi:hypothetical protein